MLSANQQENSPQTTPAHPHSPTPAAARMASLASKVQVRVVGALAPKAWGTPAHIRPHTYAAAHCPCMDVRVMPDSNELTHGLREHAHARIRTPHTRARKRTPRTRTCTSTRTHHVRRLTTPHARRCTAGPEGGLEGGRACYAVASTRTQAASHSCLLPSHPPPPNRYGSRYRAFAGTLSSRFPDRLDMSGEVRLLSALCPCRTPHPPLCV